MTKRITVIDGGMGRELLRIGAPFRQPEWSALALIEGPDWVTQAHTNFIEAGAEVITTNSYALVPFHLDDERFSALGQELADLSGRLARRAVSGSGKDVRVAGSLPPLFGSYRPDLFDAADAPRVIDPLIAGLSEHVDLWLAETMGSIAEAHAVREALDRAEDDRPLWISYTLDDALPPRVRSGESVAEATQAALDLGATAVMFNCCHAEVIGPALEIANGIAGSSAEVGGYANRFATAHGGASQANDGLSEFRDDLSPTDYREVVATWIEAGATIVGGCCGIEPDHIAEISRLHAG